MRPDPRAHNRTLSGNLFEIVFDKEHALLGSQIPYAFIIKPGIVIYRELTEASPQLTDFFVSLARLETTREKTEQIAYKLGLYIVINYRIRESTLSFDQPWTVQTMLENACVPIITDARRYLRFREYVDEALNRLAQIGVIQAWQYEPWARGVSSDPRLVQEMAGNTNPDRSAEARPGSCPTSCASAAKEGRAPEGRLITLTGRPWR